MKQEHTKFGIDIIKDRTLSISAREAILGKHGCDELAKVLVAEEEEKLARELAKAEESRTNFGIEMYNNLSLPAHVRVALLRKHGCDLLADDIICKERIGSGERAGQCN